MSIFFSLLHSSIPTVSFPDVGTYLREKQMSPRYSSSSLHDWTSFHSLMVCARSTWHRGIFTCKKKQNDLFSLRGVGMRSESSQHGLKNWYGQRRQQMFSCKRENTSDTIVESVVSLFRCFSYSRGAFQAITGGGAGRLLQQRGQHHYIVGGECAVSHSGQEINRGRSCCLEEMIGWSDAVIAYSSIV